MKKLFKYLLLATSLLTVGCNSITKSTTNSQDLVSSSEEEPISTSPNIPSFIKESEWGEEAALASYSTIGAIVPYFEADHFDYKVTKDDYGDPAIWFYLYFDTQETAESKITDYAYAAWEQEGYECVIKPNRFFDEETYSYWEQNVLYADLVIDDTNAIEIQALASQKAYNGTLMGCLGLFCFNYIPNNNPNAFPSYAVSTICGRFNDVPKLEGKDLTFSFQFFLYEGYKCLEIVVTSNTSYYELEEQYFYALLGKMFTIAQYDDLEQDFTNIGFFQTGEYPEFEDCKCYYAYPNGANYIVYFDYDLNKQAFYIDILPLLG